MDTSVADTVTLGVAAGSVAHPVASVTEWISINLKAGSTLTITYTTHNDPNTTFQFYDCLGSFLYGATMPGLDGSVSVPPATISEDAEYLLSITIVSTGGGGPGTAGGLHVVTSDDTMTVNPMVALWDDSGTNRRLEACPSYEMGIGGSILTPVFTTEASAQTALASTNVSNCVGYMSSGGPITLVSFTATDGGATLTMNGSVTSSSSSSGVSTKGCINLAGGVTLSMSWSASSGAGGFTSFTATFTLFDFQGNIVSSTGQTGTSGSTTLSIPYTGKYYVESDINGVHGTETNHDVTATTIWSEASLHVNPIVALYANGSNCASRLSCTP